MSGQSGHIEKRGDRRGITAELMPVLLSIRYDSDRRPVSGVHATSFSTNSCDGKDTAWAR